jgi:hypothetical protein
LNIFTTTPDLSNYTTLEMLTESVSSGIGLMIKNAIISTLAYIKGLAIWFGENIYIVEAGRWQYVHVDHTSRNIRLPSISIALMTRPSHRRYRSATENRLTVWIAE